MSDENVVQEAAAAVAEGTAKDIAQTAETDVKDVLVDVKDEAEKIGSEAEAEGEKIEPTAAADVVVVEHDSSNALHRAWAHVVWLEQTVAHFVTAGWKNDVESKLAALKSDIEGHAAASGTALPTSPAPAPAAPSTTATSTVA